MSDINTIIRRTLTGEASSEEHQQLDRWLSQSAENEKVFSIIKNSWEIRSEEPTYINEEEVFNKIWQKSRHQRLQSNHQNRIPFFFKIAAALIFLVVVSYYVGKNNSNTKVDSQLSNISWVVKENPPGQKSKLFLPDGSIVWLNAASSITYGSDFSDSVRLVKLQGEAFFEVAKDTLKPFIVQTEKIYTTALGTVFNINSYSENKSVDINLISGKVKITAENLAENIILNPGEAVKYNLTTNSGQKYLFDYEKTTSWKDGVLIFEDATFEEIIQTLKRWYGVEIEVAGIPNSRWQFSGRFDNEYLSNVLEVMQYNREFQYELKNEKLKIIFN